MEINTIEDLRKDKEALGLAIKELVTEFQLKHNVNVIRIDVEEERLTSMQYIVRKAIHIKVDF